MPSLPPLPPIFFLTVPVARATATTDRGQNVPLFCYETAVLPIRGQRESYESDDSRQELLRRAEQEYFENMQGRLSALVRISPPTPRANCHGWVFTCGKFGILDEFVERILDDNGYQPVELPQIGDLVLYRRGERTMHSGTVATIDGDLVLVTSKWGPFGIFQHPADCHPYDDFTYYRSPRFGHGLTIAE